MAQGQLVPLEYVQHQLSLSKKFINAVLHSSRKLPVSQPLRPTEATTGRCSINLARRLTPVQIEINKSAKALACACWLIGQGLSV